MDEFLKVLLDEENKEPIILQSTDGKDIPFEQIALIPQEEKFYCVLRPLVQLEGIGENDCIIFRVVVSDSDEENSFLVVEEDEAVAEAIYDKYIDLLKGYSTDSECGSGCDGGCCGCCGSCH